MHSRHIRHSKQQQDRASTAGAAAGIITRPAAVRLHDVDDLPLDQRPDTVHAALIPTTAQVIRALSPCWTRVHVCYVNITQLEGNHVGDEGHHMRC